jgi:hypothetical protein
MKTQRQPSFTRSDLVYAMRNRRLGRADRLNKAVAVLMERNLIEVEKIPSSHKPTISFQVHPAVLA